MRFKCFEFLVLSVLSTCSLGMETASIYMKRSDFDDQATSASGYVFQANSGGPINYSGFSDTTGDVLNFGQPSFSQGLYGAQPWPYVQKQYVPPAVLQPPFYSYGVPPDYSSYFVPSIDQQKVDLSATVNGVPTLLGGQMTRYGNGLYGGDGGEISSGHNYVKENGEKYDAAKHASHGEKGDSGYKTVEGYDKGSQGKHENEQHKGYYNQEGGNKASKHDVGEHYGKKEESAKGAQGESFSQSKSHRKGSKTTGFHKTYHKDEYKKDHSFYDEADSSGHFNKYENYNSNHEAQGGSAEKGGESEAGYHEHEKGKKGISDKGHYVDNDSGFKAAHGQNAYYNDAAEYAKKAGKEIEEQKGYSENKGEKFVL